ncbi:hypothetical protein ANTRET_LOCUS16 [Anthophora retusa]
MDVELKALIADRGSIKAALTRFRNFFNESGHSVSVGALKKRLEANTGLYDRFDTVQTRIERIIEGTDAVSAQEAEREHFEGVYFQLISEVESYIEGSQPPQRGTVADSSAMVTGLSPAFSNTPMWTNLSVIQLRSFDGNYNDWIRFRDTFLSLIHNNEQLEDVQKFHYLQSSLKGPAARIVQSICISESNERTEWDAVKARYENSAAFKRHHVHALLDLPAIQQQSPIAIREMLDDASNHLHALKALGLGIETWDPLIVPILSRKLDPISVREWERRNAPSTAESLTLRQFTAFLEERAHCLENITPLSLVGAVKPELVTVPGSRRLPRVAAHVASACEACPVCQATPAIAQCSEFKDASLEGRVKIVQNIRAYYNCLQTGHRV